MKIKIFSIEKPFFFIEEIYKSLTTPPIHTYTYISGHYNPPFSQDNNQLLTAVMLCALILYMSGGIYSLTLTPNNRFF